MDRADKEKSVKIFCCYAHEDKTFLLEIKKHLSVWERQGHITIRADTDIPPGTNQETEITDYINSSHVILFLVSPDFLASDYCYRTEIQPAMERCNSGEVCVIPIIVRSCAWEEAIFGKLPTLPANLTPVVSEKWNNRDEAFLSIAQGIKEISEELRVKEIEETEETPQLEHISFIEPNQSMKNIREAFKNLKHLFSLKTFLNKFSYFTYVYRQRSLRFVVISIILLAVSFLVMFAPFLRYSPHFDKVSLPLSSSQPLSVSDPVINSTFWSISGDMSQYSPLNPPSKQQIGVERTDGHFSDPFYYLYFEFHNQAKIGVIIDTVQLTINKIQPIQQPVPIWQNGPTSSLNYQSHFKYEALYDGRNKILLTRCVSPDYKSIVQCNTVVPAGQSENIEVHLISRLAVEVAFNVKVFYHKYNEALLSHQLSIKRSFEMLFVDSVHWQEYGFQDGHLMRAE